MKNVFMYSADNETRPAITIDRVNNLELTSVKAETKTRTTPAIYIRNSKNIIASFCRILGEGNLLFAEEGNSVEMIHLSDNILQPGQIEIAQVDLLRDKSFFEEFDTDL